MLNQTVIVGRLVGDIKVNTDDKSSIITLSISRSFKNSEGEYESDIVRVSLSKHISENIIEHCVQGDLLGVKGTLSSIDGKDLVVKAEKVTFLSSKKQ